MSEEQTKMQEEQEEENTQSSNSSFSPTFVTPGTDVEPYLASSSKHIVLGRGLRQMGGRVIATLSGILFFQKPSSYWVESNSRRYQAQVGDSVVGVIQDRNAESYRVNLFGNRIGVLPKLAFDGASKRNNPNLNRGDLVFCHVTHNDPHTDVMLSCFATKGPKKDWMTEEAMFGPLKTGTSIRVSHTFAQRLLNPSNRMLAALGEALPFEMVVGVNGLVWVRAGSLEATLVVVRALQFGESLSDEESEVMVEALMEEWNQENK
jgi:exosome complex component RRP40